MGPQITSKNSDKEMVNLNLIKNTPRVGFYDSPRNQTDFTCKFTTGPNQTVFSGLHQHTLINQTTSKSNSEQLAVEHHLNQIRGQFPIASP